MHQLANAWPASDWTPDVREGPQQPYMVKKRIAEAFGGRRKVDPGILQDALELG
jgi:hypothetical protein